MDTQKLGSTRKLLLVATASFFLLGLRAPNGELIREGEPADKLLINLGRPLAITSGGLTLGGNTISDGQTWTYRIGDIIYRFAIDDGKIISERWDRVHGARR
ncbi:hypothetical protein [Methylogaea oryzae]|uniref:Uncharacterized protein n=1 Tax=Methylogaea oryzae TaxID=1295382 RepID=A0A8D4VRU8_9GAMM|nr:hypothetical protein [Methylogaea oryzae]BBL72577.1 hypothetical protein MoryE10_31830 [Methylogaea oryzae]